MSSAAPVSAAGATASVSDSSSAAQVPAAAQGGSRKPKKARGAAVPEDGSSASAVAAAACPVLPRPRGVHIIADFLSTALAAPLLESVAYLMKGEVSFGHARKEEDDLFGLKRPKPIDQALYGTTLQRITEIDLARLEAEQTVDSAASASASAVACSSVPAPNRLTLTILLPGQGQKPAHESGVYGDVLSVLNLGPSHTVLELCPRKALSEDAIDGKHTMLVPAGALVLLSGPARQDYEYSIPGKTRDVLPAGVAGDKDLNLKRGKTTLCFLRQVVNVDADESASSCESANKKKARASASEPREKKEKKISSTAMRVPTTSPPAVAAASSAVVATSPAEDAAAESAAALMEQLHVQGVYDSIATHFSNTRHTPWPRIERFVEQLAPGLDVADVGCGNGKYMGLNPGVRIRGCDSSSKLVEICRSRGFDVIEGDILSVPFESSSFDAVLCIAVLHHLSTDARRLQAARELLRLLRPGGQLLCSAWALEQDVTSRRAFPSQDVLVPWNVPKRFVEHDPKAQQVADDTQRAQQQAAREASPETEPDAAASAASAASSSSATSSPSPSAPLLDPSGVELVQFQRYCHVYRSGELEELFTSQYELGVDIEIVEKYYDRGNWAVIVKKLR